MAISTKTTLTNYPDFVQSDSTCSQECLIGLNVLPRLGVTIHCANGESTKLVGGDVSQSNLRLIRAVVVPGNKAKYVEAALDIP